MFHVYYFKAAKANIVSQIHVQKQRIGLKHLIHRPLMGQHALHFAPRDQKPPSIEALQTRRSFATMMFCHSQTTKAG